MLLYILIIAFIQYASAVHLHNATIVSIRAHNEIVIEHADIDINDLSQYSFPVQNIDGSLKYTETGLLLDCVADECQSDVVSTDELSIVSTYASYIESMNSFRALNRDHVKFGLLKSKADTNVHGLFIYSEGVTAFYVRPSPILTANSVDTAYLLLSNIAAHERAHEDSFAMYGIGGHGDNFQIVFNTLFWNSLENVAQYKQLFQTPMYGGLTSTPADTDHTILIVGILVVVAIMLAVIFICALKPPAKNLIASNERAKLIENSYMANVAKDLKF